MTKREASPAWHRQHECEWLLTPTTGYTYAVRRISDGAVVTCGWYVWLHGPDELRELIAGGVVKGSANAKKHARADWNARQNATTSKESK